MTTSGTEPGDFVDLDMDSIAVDRQLRLLGLVQDVLGDLQRESGRKLELEHVDQSLHLSHDGRLVYVASLSHDGRLVVTEHIDDGLL
jgi:hypothetical protein